jgi:hypothetical protein
MAELVENAVLAGKLTAMAVTVLVVTFLYNWWMWPGKYRWLARIGPRMFGPEARARIQPYETAIRRALDRHRKATGEVVQFVDVVRAPLRLHISRYSLWKSVAWGLARTDDGRERFVCVSGWYTSDSVMPEFFDR